MSRTLFHLDAENWTQKFRISLSVRDTVVITGGGASCAAEAEAALHVLHILALVPQHIDPFRIVLSIF